MTQDQKFPAPKFLAPKSPAPNNPAVKTAQRQGRPIHALAPEPQVQPLMSRRKALGMAASLPAVALAGAAGVAGVTGSAAPASAALALQGQGQPLFQRFALGGWELTALLAGQSRNDEPRKTFGLNVPEAEFAAVSQAAFIAPDWTAGSFTPVLVNTGAALVLFDTGLAPAAMRAALAAAGVAPEAVDVVVLTHMHGDHIGGLLAEDGSPSFANARYVTGRIEYDHWAAAGNAGFDAKVRPLAPKMTMLEDGQEALPGLTAMAAFGHTPGHMAWHLENQGQRLMLTADTANHHVWSLQNPDWEVRFDADKPAAANTRRKIFGMIAAEKLPFLGYHMPFPALGYVAAEGAGFRYVPHSYQLAILP